MTVLETRDLKKYYGAGDTLVKALDGVDLQVENGEFVAIVGTSGSGKSTLLHILGGLDRPTGGSVLVDGKDIFSLKDEELTIFRRRKIGFVFQAYNLVPVLSAYENIILPIQLDGGRVDKDYVGRVIEALGLEQRLNSLPSQLSGGQQQRVAIARALAANPKVLLCDEATSALDPTTSRSILDLLKEINQKFGITIVVITHEMSVIEEICDRVAIIDNSRIAEIGSVEDIFMRPKTEIARRLLYASGRLGEEMMSERCLRIIFDGTKTSSPVIGNMVLECGAPVNILFADTKTIEGQMVGYTLVQLPDNEGVVAKMKKYLDMHQVHYLEEAYHV